MSSHSDHIPDVSHVDRDSIISLSIFDAAMTGNLSALQELLKTHNADSIQPATGLSALHYASSRGHIHLVNYLLDKAGATVDLEDREGEVINHITCGTDFACHIVFKLVSFQTALLKAAYNGYVDIVAVLVEKHDADVSHQDKDGWSALHNACSCNHPGIASLLLDHYTNIDIVSKMGHTPLSKT